MDTGLLALLQGNPANHQGLQQPNEDDDEVLPLGRAQIRLIHILPRDTGYTGPVRCKMIVVSLIERPEYVALSYTWGSPPAHRIIEIDGREVLVRKNLWRFLNRSSVCPTNGQHVILSIFAHRDALEGIDALCIRQTNAVEVAQQISFMGYIYSMAVKVMVWLGPAHSDSDLAMQALSNCHSRRPSNRFWNTPGGLAVARLCNRAYWTRLWILQEIIRARTNIVILCGEKAVEWIDFSSVMVTNAWQQGQRQQDRNMDYQSLVRSPAMVIVKQSVHTPDNNPWDHELWVWIMANRSLKCWEPRDKVYALLGVANFNPELGKNIKADYRVPVVRLVNDVLNMHHKTGGVPANIETVVAQCNQLTDAFDLGLDRIYDLVRHDGTQELIEVKNGGANCPLGDPALRGVTRWWALYYGHRAVERVFGEGFQEDLNRTWYWAIENEEASVTTALLQLHRVPPLKEFLMADKLSLPLDVLPLGLLRYNASGAECHHRSPRIVEVVVKYGTLSDEEGDNPRASTPLSAAVNCTTSWLKDTSIIRPLLAPGVNMDPLSCGYTALSIAIFCGHNMLIHLLSDADSKHANWRFDGDRSKAEAMEGLLATALIHLLSHADSKHAN
ncbi:hypothetical protein LTR17_009348 [Elasticomyces elasticus]|nr:hypothetical protein LTR17_009348 [Elasticomyces elasticus]